MKTAIALIAAAGFAGAANADVIISEVLGSTTGADSEYIEITNTGPNSVDLTGWTVELWDSDLEFDDNGTIVISTGYGLADAESPYALGGTLAAGETFLLANQNAATAYGINFADIGGLLDGSGIENSAYTIVLADAMGNMVFSVFVQDDPSTLANQANRAGTAITPDFIVGPDGSFLPAGFQITDAGIAALDDFFGPNEGTPGEVNAGLTIVPTPGATGMLALAGLAAARRRRA